MAEQQQNKETEINNKPQMETIVPVTEQPSSENKSESTATEQSSSETISEQTVVSEPSESTSQTAVSEPSESTSLESNIEESETDQVDSPATELNEKFNPDEVYMFRGEQFSGKQLNAVSESILAQNPSKRQVLKTVELSDATVEHSSKNFTSMIAQGIFDNVIPVQPEPEPESGPRVYSSLEGLPADFFSSFSSEQDQSDEGSNTPSATPEEMIIGKEDIKNIGKEDTEPRAKVLGTRKDQIADLEKNLNIRFWNGAKVNDDSLIFTSHPYFQFMREVYDRTVSPEKSAANPFQVGEIVSSNGVPYLMKIVGSNFVNALEAISAYVSARNSGGFEEKEMLPAHEQQTESQKTTEDLNVELNVSQETQEETKAENDIEEELSPAQQRAKETAELAKKRDDLLKEQADLDKQHTEQIIEEGRQIKNQATEFVNGIESLFAHKASFSALYEATGDESFAILGNQINLLETAKQTYLQNVVQESTHEKTVEEYSSALDQRIELVDGFIASLENATEDDRSKLVQEIKDSILNEYAGKLNDDSLSDIIATFKSVAQNAKDFVKEYDAAEQSLVNNIKQARRSMKASSFNAYVEAQNQNSPEHNGAQLQAVKGTLALLLGVEVAPVDISEMESGLTNDDKLEIYADVVEAQEDQNSIYTAFDSATNAVESLYKNAEQMTAFDGLYVKSTIEANLGDGATTSTVADYFSKSLTRQVGVEADKMVETSSEEEGSDNPIFAGTASELAKRAVARMTVSSETGRKMSLPAYELHDVLSDLANDKIYENKNTEDQR